jgi:hypothetical protein
MVWDREVLSDDRIALQQRKDGRVCVGVAHPRVYPVDRTLKLGVQSAARCRIGDEAELSSPAGLELCMAGD